MHITEVVSKVNEVRPDLEMNVEILKNQSRPYFIRGLKSLQSALTELRNIDSVSKLSNDILELRSLQIDVDEASLSVDEYNDLKNRLNILTTTLDSIVKLIDIKSPDDDRSFRIRLPEMTCFEDMAKIAGQLKLAIDLPLGRSNEKGPINILRGESGSVWLYVALVSPLAIKLIGTIAHLALDLKIKYSENQRHMEYNKMIGANADMAESLSKLHNSYIVKHLAESSKEIGDEFYSGVKTDELIKIIKTSTESMGELFEKGALFLPAKQESSSKSSIFPSAEDIKALTEGVKQIVENTPKP